MSWSIRDYKDQNRTDVDHPAPAIEYQDDAPLPTYAVGLEAYADGGWPTSLPAWQKRAMHEQGLWTQPELDRWSRLMRRGIEPL